MSNNTFRTFTPTFSLVDTLGYETKTKEKKQMKAGNTPKVLKMRIQRKGIKNKKSNRK